MRDANLNIGIRLRIFFVKTSIARARAAKISITKLI
jgi:hypothetical protein